MHRIISTSVSEEDWKGFFTQKVPTVPCSIDEKDYLPYRAMNDRKYEKWPNSRTSALKDKVEVKPDVVDISEMQSFPSTHDSLIPIDGRYQIFRCDRKTHKRDNEGCIAGLVMLTKLLQHPAVSIAKCCALRKHLLDFFRSIMHLVIRCLILKSSLMQSLSYARWVLVGDLNFSFASRGQSRCTSLLAIKFSQSTATIKLVQYPT